MLLSRFTLAQSRLLSIVVASYLVAISRLSRAADVPAASNLDVVGRPVLDAPPAAFPPPQDDDIRDDGNGAYVPEFDYFDRSLLGRQEQQLPQTFELKDNLKEEKDIAPGVTQYFVLKRGQKRLTRTDEAALDAPEARGTVHMSEEGLDQDAVAIKDEQDAETDDGDGELRRRQAGNRVWISANTCRQPNPPTNGTAGTKNHPQLVMYVSTSSQNQKPGPDSTDDLATPPTGILFESGFANFSVQANSDVYIGISAPNLEPGWFGSWHFDVAASTDGPHHSYNSNNPFLFMIDTDSDSALFITYNLSQPGTNDTDKWMENNPFKMYAFEADHVTDVTGMERSLCALQNYNRTTNISYDLSITTKFGGDLPKSQFHLQGLKAGKTYNGFLTVQGGTDVLQLPSGNTVRGGGMVFQQFNWTTKSSM
jgi:calcium channel MID1